MLEFSSVLREEWNEVGGDDEGEPWDPGSGNTDVTNIVSTIDPLILTCGGAAGEKVLPRGKERG